MFLHIANHFIWSWSSEHLAYVFILLFLWLSFLRVMKKFMQKSTKLKLEVQTVKFVNLRETVSLCDMVEVFAVSSFILQLIDQCVILYSKVTL